MCPGPVIQFLPQGSCTKHLLLFAIRFQKRRWLNIMVMHVYSPGTEADNPWGQTVFKNINLLSIRSVAASVIFIIKCIKWLCNSFLHSNHIWPCRLRCYVLSFKIIGHLLFILVKKNLKVRTIYGRGGHLGHVNWTMYLTLRIPVQRRLHFYWPRGVEEDLWKWWKTDEHGYTINPPCEPDGSGELKLNLWRAVKNVQNGWVRQICFE